MKVKKIILAVAGVAALAVPAAALAGHGHGSNHPVSYIFKGTYQGDGVVTVNHGNAHARHAGLVDGDVTFDLSSAHLNVADTNADTVIDSPTGRPAGRRPDEPGRRRRRRGHGVRRHGVRRLVASA